MNEAPLANDVCMRGFVVREEVSLMNNSFGKIVNDTYTDQNQGHP